MLCACQKRGYFPWDSTWWCRNRHYRFVIGWYLPVFISSQYYQPHKITSWIITATMACIKNYCSKKREKIDQLCQLYGSTFFSPSQFQHWEKVASISDLIIHMLIRFFSHYSPFTHIKDLPFEKQCRIKRAYILYVPYILATE